MDTPFLVMMIAIMAGSIAHRYQAPGDPAAPERRRRLRAAVPILIMVAALFYAGLLALASFALLYGVTFGAEPRETVLLVMIPGLAAASILFAWIGLRLDRAHNLLIRLKRACNAGLDAFFEPDGKPKPEIDRDLD